MSKSHFPSRAIAIFLLTIFLPSILPLNLLYASNNGPVAPEATGFEPIDAKDMVNLVTGDFSYVLPLLNVPSPEGGYPVSLAYHAGIAVDQEASWVGLGWALNPGSLNRGVNGVPDDWKSTKINQIVYDAGGEITSYTGSVSVGWGESMYSVGLYAGYSEHKSFGGENSYSFNGGLMGSVGNYSASVGTNGASAGFTGIYASTSFKAGGSSVGVNVASMDFSISSRSNFAASVGGNNISFFGNNNNSPAAVNINNTNYSISFPIYGVTIGLGYRKTKYWTYQKEYLEFYGSLYAGKFTDEYSQKLFPYKLNFDSYEALYEYDADKQLRKDNLSLISYDNYSVSGQGISGSIKPHLFQHGSLVNKRNESSSAVVSYKAAAVNTIFTKSMDKPNDDIHFYFENENSSYLKVRADNWNTIFNPSDYPSVYHLTPNTLFQSYLNPDSGYSAPNKRKRTGTYIETYTNQEIIQNPAVIQNPANFNRSNTPQTGIGAFKITTLDGKTYHYSLPVYQKEQFSRSSPLEKDINLQYYEEQKLELYATHWLLTAITGPDYVDNGNNVLDEGDFGYWVEFDYGKWSDGYIWSTPKTAGSYKQNEKSKFAQWGVKELYYLDKIKTRTHTAIFVKETREDDKSTSINISDNGSYKWINDTERGFAEGTDGNWYFNGIYEKYQFPLSPAQLPNHFMMSNYGTLVKSNPHKVLKLKKILLLQNARANISKSNSNAVSPSHSGHISLIQNHKLYNILGQQINEQDIITHSRSWQGEFYNNVYDVADFQGLGLDAECDKIIDLNYEYGLADNSPNSTAPTGGRLCLKELKMLGAGGEQAIPSYFFDYNGGVAYDQNKEDNWGYYKDNAAVWSLNKIITPTGSELNIVYEPDDIDREAVPGSRVFDSGLQFSFSQSGSYLLINIQKEVGNSNPINFTDYFQTGALKASMWCCYRRDYEDLDPLNFGCHSKKFTVDFDQPSPQVQVLNVSATGVTLRTSINYATSDNGNEFLGKIVGLNYHPDMIRENLERGACGNPPGCAGSPSARLVLQYSLHGNKTSLSEGDKIGGGIRVKEINLTGEGLDKYVTRYYYNLPGFDKNQQNINYRSSGVTSYVPQKYFKEIKYITELPPPTVLYEYVTVEHASDTGEINSSNRYNFEVYPTVTGSGDNFYMGTGSQVMYEAVKYQANEINNINMGQETFNLNLSRFEVKDYTACLGRIKSNSVYNSRNHLLSKVEYRYKDNGNLSSQGVYQETFSTYKRIDNGDVNYRIGFSSKATGPNILSSISTTKGGYTTVQSIDKLDFLTGQALETSFMSSDGKVYKTKIVPAYVKYSGMGSKVDNALNKNMLTQTAAEYQLQLDPSSNTYKETGIGITTWSNLWTYKSITGDNEPAAQDQGKVWRKHKTYIWNGVVDNNGIFQNYNSANDDNFNWSLGVGSQPAQWIQSSKVNLYNHFSVPLEITDINNNNSATKLNYGDQNVICTGSAAYSEMFYSGAENITNNFWLEPEIRLVDGQRSSELFHTGKFSIAATSQSQLGVVLRAGQHRAGKYKLSVWVHKDNAASARVRLWDNVGTTTYQFSTTEKYTAGNWVQLNCYLNIPVNETYVYVNSVDESTVFLDDFRLHPVATSMTGYVYDNRGRMEYTLGSNNFAVKYVYDNQGRLIRTYTEAKDDPVNGIVGGFKLISESNYYYKNL
jgi:hypothetical protein